MYILGYELKCQTQTMRRYLYKVVVQWFSILKLATKYRC
jgi:hypothetical protein